MSLTTCTGSVYAPPAPTIDTFSTVTLNLGVCGGSVGSPAVAANAAQNPAAGDVLGSAGAAASGTTQSTNVVSAPVDPSRHTARRAC